MEAIFYVIFLILVVLGVMAVVSVIRGFVRKPPKGAAEPVQPFVEYPPPPGVVRTKAVTRTAWLAVLWALLNLAGLAAWATGGLSLGTAMAEVPMTVRVTAAGYLLVATIYAAMGGVLLMAGKAHGRRMLSWSGFLFVTLVVLLVGISLVVWSSGKEAATRQTAMYMGIGLLIHLVVDTLLAASAQRVGLPAQPVDVAATEAGPSD